MAYNCSYRQRSTSEWLLYLLLDLCRHLYHQDGLNITVRTHLSVITTHGHSCHSLGPLGPTGQSYYYNVQTQESTYVRPLPTFPIMPQAAVPAAPTKKAKKEKPLVKTPVPGTPWLRVITTEGNTFYTHTGEKRSVWIVPEEIKDVVEALEREEALKKAEDAKRADEERAREMGRIQSEVTGMVGKRKAEEPVPVDEYVVTKKAKVDGEEEEEEDEDDEDEESEEGWQREAAAQLAAEAEEEERRREEEKEQEEEEARQLKEAEKQKGSAQLSMPERVDLSLDEAKALFKVGETSVETTAAGTLLWPFRHFCARRTPIPYILGTRPCRSSFQTLDMFYFLPSRRAVRHSMSTAETGLASSGSQK